MKKALNIAKYLFSSIKTLAGSFKLVLLICFTSLSTFSLGTEDPIDKTKISEYFQNQLYTEAIQYLESKRAETSTDLNLVNSLGYAYFMYGNYTTAERHYTHVLNVDSLNFTANRYMALIQNAYKNYPASLFYYNRLIRLQPNNAWLYKYSGDAYSINKQPDSALMCYEKAYRLQSQNAKIVYAYANNLVDKDLYTKADSVLKNFLLTDSTNVLIMALGIKSAVEQHKWANAAAFNNRWLLSGEADPSTSAKLALANYSIKNYEACYRVCDTLLGQGYELESLLYYASQAMYKLNDYNKSSELLRRCLALSISKNSNIYYFSLADNFESQKKYLKAITAYDTAYYLFKDPLALYNIGRLYEKGLNNKTLAQQFYKKYMLVAKPKTEDEKRVYAYVKEMLALPKK